MLRCKNCTRETYSVCNLEERSISLTTKAPVLPRGGNVFSIVDFVPKDMEQMHNFDKIESVQCCSRRIRLRWAKMS
jgi:hypothetical protein